MYQYISKLLLERGFFEVNGKVSRYLGPNEYRVLEDEGIISVERDFDGSTEEKNLILDHVQGLSKRYSLTGANIRGGKLKVFLTRPGDDGEEEAIRIDFLTKSIEKGIRDITGKDEPAPEASLSAHRREEPAPVIEEAATGWSQEESVTSVPQKYPASQKSGEDVARSKPEKAGVHGATPPRDKARPRATSPYIPPDENPNLPGYRQPLTVSVIDRRFSFPGFLGAFLGAILGAILIGVVRTMGLPAHYLGFIVPFLVILLYRIMAEHQMPISLGIILVLTSLLMGSVLSNAVDILASGSSTGIMRALLGGIRSHLDNENYYVFNVWLKYGMSVLTAAIPTILLLTGGKKRTIVY